MPFGGERLDSTATQHYRWVVIPPFDSRGLLPQGLHWAEWDEITERFGTNPHRRRLLTGLLRALQNLRGAGCGVAYLDGSFVTATPTPNDFDACWDLRGVALDRVDPVLKVFSHGRALQKLKYLGELFPSHARADAAGRPFLDFFQTDKAGGDPKGLIALSLDGLPR
jgi:hypothetical protein